MASFKLVWAIKFLGKLFYKDNNLNLYIAATYTERTSTNKHSVWNLNSVRQHPRHGNTPSWHGTRGRRGRGGATRTKSGGGRGCGGIRRSIHCRWARLPCGRVRQLLHVCGKENGGIPNSQEHPWKEDTAFSYACNQVYPKCTIFKLKLVEFQTIVSVRFENQELIGDTAEIIVISSSDSLLHLGESDGTNRLLMIPIHRLSSAAWHFCQWH